jgi:allantoicase
MMKESLPVLSGEPSCNVNFTKRLNLASAKLGAKVLSANDEFFAPKENLLKLGKAIFIEDKYTPRGKWMDGWETRRRRVPGYDWCIVKLGVRGIVRGVNVDTSFFVGNYPEHCSIEVCDLASDSKLKSASWTEILPQSQLKGGGDNLFQIDSARPFTHLRLNIYPDGGVARLRVYGDVVLDLEKAKAPFDLAAAQNGGRAILSSNEFFGAPNNMLMPGRAKNMGDGWETKRRRGPGHDWAVIRLAALGTLEKIEIDTNHFKGNYPDSFLLEGRLFSGADEDVLQTDALWTEIMPNTKLKAHTRHCFAKEIRQAGPFSHVRLSIYPDGGVSRLRIYGQPQAS